MEFETVREALEFLLDINQTPEKMFNKPAFEDLQEDNKEALFSICDLLGMSELYLEDERKSKF